MLKLTEIKRSRVCLMTRVNKQYYILIIQTIELFSVSVAMFMYSVSINRLIFKYINKTYRGTVEFIRDLDQIANWCFLS